MRFSQVKPANSEQEVNAWRLTQQLWKIHITTHCFKEQAGRSPLPGGLSKDRQTTGPCCGHAEVKERSVSLFRSIPATRAAQQGSALAEHPVNQMLFSLELWGHQGHSTDEIKEKSETKALMKGCAN